MDKLTWILSSCVLIAAVAAIRALFGKRLRPGVRYALWLLVLIRLLYPGTVAQSPVSVPAAAARTEIVQNVEALRGVQSIEHMANGSVEGMPRYELMPDRPVTVAPEPVTPERFARMQTTLKARDLILPIWYVGIAVTTVVFAATNLRFYSNVRARRRRIEADCPIPVYAVENLSSSCLFGRAVYVAAETAQDETQLRHVLSHELSHYRHGDYLWSLLRCAALAIHWYNPLVWWAAKLSRQDSELFADAGALARLGEDERESYGVTLIRLSARHEAKAPLLCAATTMTNGKAALRERVTMIAKRPRMTAAVLAAVLLIAAVAAGCTFTGAKKTPDNTPVDAQTETISPAELRWFNEEFFKPETDIDGRYYPNLHLQFLSSTYATPEDVDLFELFYCGTGEVAEPLSADEHERFGSTECATDKISAGAMDAVFYENTGMHLDETKKIGLDKFVYSPDYDAYYNTHGDSNYRGQVTLYGGTHEGELVHLYYEDTFYGDGWKCVTLREAGAGEWHFVSNLPCEKPILPTSYPAGEPWKTIPLSELTHYELTVYEPEKIATERHTGDFVKRIGGYSAREGVVVCWYQATDGNIYAAVVDNGDTANWSARTFLTLADGAQDPSISFFHDLFGHDGLVLYYNGLIGNDIYGTRCAYYFFDADGTPSLLAEFGTNSPGMAYLSDLNGDGENELVVDGEIPRLFFQRNGKIYRLEHPGELVAEREEVVTWLTWSQYDRFTRCLTVFGSAGEQGEITVRRCVYFDGENLLVYKVPAIAPVDHVAAGVDAPEQVIADAKEAAEAEVQQLVNSDYGERFADWVDDWCVSDLTCTKTERAEYTVETYNLGMMLHASDPKKVGLAGGMYLTEDDWVGGMNTQPAYLLYTVTPDGTRTRLEGDINWESGPPNDRMFPSALARIELENGLCKPSEISSLTLERMFLESPPLSMNVLGAYGADSYTEAVVRMVEAAEQSGEQEYFTQRVNDFAVWADRANPPLTDEGRAAFAYLREALAGESLSPAQLLAWKETLSTFAVENDEYTFSPISCFFTSYYSDPRDLDLADFLGYCPLAESVEDEAEFNALHVEWEIGEGEDRHNATMDEFPLPTHRYRVARINEVLTKYAGITLDDMHTDWRSVGKPPYLPEYDAFYNFTSDFGPGMFEPTSGTQTGDLVTLRSAHAELRVQVLGGDAFHILSYQPLGE